MKDQSTIRGYQYVRRSVRRQRLMGLLNQPMTPAQLAGHIQMTTNTVCKVVAELRKHGLVKCLVPGIQRGRPYVRTTYGEKVWSLIEERSTAQEPQGVLPKDDHVAYALVCHRQRSAVVRGLGVPRRAAEIKRWLRSNLPGVTISANNVRDVLGKLCMIGATKRIDDGRDRFPVFALTERGQRFRDLLDQAAKPEVRNSLDAFIDSEQSLTSGGVRANE